ncbi:two component transcriptional regulator, LytTR family [Geotalea uraniireducens Rf4]|uniref:Two component transcriptional regulator, LytTR family n=2 Tax=Geotalea uraniireducens TaxID=351604 RepID=A5G4A4_GEOUR|nr:two component transcriptional regulator, LytTR family [Geotalea uraniireducens Rf4]
MISASGKRPTAIIVDDEPHLCAFLKRQLTSCWPELDILAEANNGPDALRLIGELHPDVAFLDIRMPGIDGLDLASRVGTLCHVVFVTAYDQYAMQAFENAAVDYLLKPVALERLNKTVNRLKSQLSSVPPDLSPLIAKLSEQIRPQKQYLQWLQVSSHNDIELIPVDEVEFFQASDKYTLVVTRNTERIMRKSLKELEEELDPERFWRVHRNAIVRVAAIARISRDFRGHHVLHLHQGGRTLAVGRNYSHLFRQMRLKPSPLRPNTPTHRSATGHPVDP